MNFTQEGCYTHSKNEEKDEEGKDRTIIIL